MDDRCRRDASREAVRAGAGPGRSAHDVPALGTLGWQWNIAEGETICYLTRPEAHRVGLLPGVGTDDWWLFDSTRLAVMHFDEDGYRTGMALVTDPEAVAQACAWRDLATRYATADDPAP